MAASRHCSLPCSRRTCCSSRSRTGAVYALFATVIFSNFLTAELATRPATDQVSPQTSLRMQPSGCAIGHALISKSHCRDWCRSARGRR